MILIKVVDIVKKVNEPDYFPYKHIKNEDIEYFLENKQFTDTLNTQHKGYKDTIQNHAQRIASIINLIKNGIIINPVHIYIVDDYYEIEDGHHRLRAFHYLNKRIPVILWNMNT
jgi:hypothetical protein